MNDAMATNPAHAKGDLNRLVGRWKGDWVAQISSVTTDNSLNVWWNDVALARTEAGLERAVPRARKARQAEGARVATHNSAVPEAEWHEQHQETDYDGGGLVVSLCVWEVETAVRQGLDCESGRWRVVAHVICGDPGALISWEVKPTVVGTDAELVQAATNEFDAWLAEHRKEVST